MAARSAAAREGVLLGLAVKGLAVALAVAGGLLVSPAQAQAQAQAPAQAPASTPLLAASIGIMDLQYVMSEATAAQQVLRQREQYLETYQAHAAAVEKELRAVDQELADLRGTRDERPGEDLTQRQKDFQARVAAFQREVQTRRRNLERAFGDAMSDIQSVVIRVADEVAGERGMNIVLHRSQVFLFDPALDLTDDVLARVNVELPTASMADPDALPPLDSPPTSTIFRQR